MRNGRRPTLEDVAARAGVSRSLVSLVMRGSDRVRATTRVHVLAVAEELGYRPNIVASMLASRRSHTIGILANDLHNPFYAEIADGIDAVTGPAGYRLLFANAFRRATAEAEALEMFLSLGVDGIALLSPVVPLDAIEQAAKVTPVVVVGRRLIGSPVDHVVVDDRAGALLAAEHLISLGHRRIVHIDGGDGAGAAERTDGYRAAMRRAGLAAHVRVEQGAMSHEAGIAAMESVLATATTAVFAANDLQAMGVLTRALTGGRRVPADLSVVGFDDSMLASVSPLPLTTVHQPREHIGRIAATALLERIDGRIEPIAEIVAPSLVIRATTAPPPAR